MKPQHLEKISCPICNVEQLAIVQHTEPFYTYIHNCTSCDYLIMESEWNKILPDHLQILLTNKIVAIFSGGKEQKNFSGNPAVAFDTDTANFVIAVDSLEYHKSFDWLMHPCYILNNLKPYLVNDKLMFSRLEKNITEYNNLSQELQKAVTTFDINILYPVVVKFIIWFNKTILAE